ncbi:MAG TPA: helix-turn-helix domain-containing protein [Terriglobales bacterium]|nr:helix-turn-helix domain-containing protein [Terriglobales bacterium]HVA64085.1 helix-turn-helix domain-containing protein [Terriglobales bacterium]
MAYQRQELAELVGILAREHPRLTELEISRRLGVHRHTLRRALEGSGLSLALIKQEVVLARLGRAFAAEPAGSLKEAWTELGFASAAAFARYVRRATGKSPTQLRGGRLGQLEHKRDKMRLDAPVGSRGR